MIIAQRPLQTFTTQPIPQQVVERVMSCTESAGACDFPRFPYFVKSCYQTTTLAFLSSSRACDAALAAIRNFALVVHVVFQGREIAAQEQMLLRMAQFLQTLAQERIPLASVLSGIGFALPLPENSSLVRAACAFIAGPGVTLHLSIMYNGARIFQFGGRGPFAMLHSALHGADAAFAYECPLPLPDEPVGGAPQRSLCELDDFQTVQCADGAVAFESALWPQIAPNVTRSAPGTLEYYQINKTSVLRAVFEAPGVRGACAEQLCQFFAREDVQQLVEQLMQRHLAQYQVSPTDVLFTRDGFWSEKRILVSADVADAVVAALERGGGDAGGGYELRCAGDVAVMSQSGTLPDSVF